VFTTQQALSSGVSKGLLRRRLGSGYLRQVDGVYVVAGSVDTWHRRVSLATLSVKGGVASHATAARLWGLTDSEPLGIEVSAIRWRRRHRDFVVHESLDLSPQDRTWIAGIEVTVATRTVVDLGATARWLVEPALETGIRHGLLSVPDVRRFVDRVSRRGRRGVGVIRPLLERRERWDQATDSELEARFLRALEGYSLPLPVSQHTVRAPDGTFVCRADFAYIESRVLIELDSEAFHMDRLAFRRDRAKQNQTELLGWRTLRYTWWDVVERPGRIYRDIRTALSLAEHA
jgi:hypothetical protein